MDAIFSAVAMCMALMFLAFIGLGTAGYVHDKIENTPEKIEQRAKQTADDYEQAKRNIHSPQLEWVIGAGRMNAVQSMQFENCKADYYGYTCISTTKSLYNAPIKSARITLRPDGDLPYDIIKKGPYKDFSRDIRNVPAQDLGFQGVYFDLSYDTKNEQCMDKQLKLARIHDPEAKIDEYPWGAPKICLKEKGRDYFFQTLKEHGWQTASEREILVFHPNENIAIASERTGGYQFVIISDDKRQKLTEQVQARTKNELERQQNAQQVINQLQHK